MERRRLNKVLAGYHMLMIISNVDGEFSMEEGMEIVKYLEESFPFDINMDNELEVLSALSREEYFNHFVNAMNDFYLDSTESERILFLNSVVKMVIADKKITVEENSYLNELYNAWDSEHLD